MMAGIAMMAIACKKKTQHYTVQTRMISDAVYASGEIMPESYHFLKSNSADLLLKMLVTEGDSIRSNQEVAILGTPSQLTQLNLLSKQATLAERNTSSNAAALMELQENIALAKTKHEQDLINATRYTELASTQAVSAKDAEQARLQASQSATSYQALQQQYRTKKNELDEKSLQVQQQLAAIAQSREGKVLKSPVDGRVFKVYLKEGDLAPLNEPVAMIGTPGHFKLELLVDERDISRIATGQTVYFETEVYNNQQFSATISKIIPLLQKESRSFQVEATVTDKRTFYPQSSVEANIIVRDSVRALVIPAAYLLKGDSVYLQQPGGLRKTAVTTGVKNDNWIEIKQGLKAGDVIAQNE